MFNEAGIASKYLVGWIQWLEFGKKEEDGWGVKGSS